MPVKRKTLSCLLFASNCLFLASAVLGETNHFAWDAEGGTLARDHQSRAIYHEGEHKRTYVAYMDHSFFARITYYDHETQRWVKPPVLLDDCIRPDGRFNHAYKDGHNVPNLFITRDGTIHIFYGAHVTQFKYARTKEPENIQYENWDLDMRVGQAATYPFFAQTQDNTLYVFYRYAPYGSYNVYDKPGPFLGMQFTRDNGQTWSDINKLATFPAACKIHRGAYDSVKNRIHLMIHPRGPLGGRRGSVHCMYDPENGKLVSLNDKVLGPMGTVESFKKNLPKIFYRLVDFELYNGKPYFLYKDQDGQMHFGYWGQDEWVDLPLAEGDISGIGRDPVIHTSDGQNFKVFGITDLAARDSGKHGGVIKLWESSDGGKTWNKGKLIAGREQFGHGFQAVNKVMQYSGSGPLFIASEPTSGPYEHGRYDHYDHPARRDKKLYAFDAEGHVIPAD